MEYIYLGQTPADEDCTQVGEENYSALARVECRVWINQLNRSFPIPERLASHCQYKIKSFNHDFGMYFEVVLAYSGGIIAACDFADNVEGNCPSEWDTEARVELGITSSVLET